MSTILTSLACMKRFVYTCCVYFYQYINSRDCLVVFECCAQVTSPARENCGFGSGFKFAAIKCHTGLILFADAQSIDF